MVHFRFQSFYFEMFWTPLCKEAFLFKFLSITLNINNIKPSISVFHCITYRSHSIALKSQTISLKSHTIAYRKIVKDMHEMAVWGRFAPYAETNWIFYIALIYLPNVHMISVLFLTHDPHTSSDTQNTFGGQLNKNRAFSNVR